MIDFNSALIYFDCESQKCIAHRARGRTPGCSSCDYAGEYTVYLGTLFSNLAIAAGLCAAYEMGYAEHGREMYRGVEFAKSWRPNTDAKPAPGFLAAVSMEEGE